MKTGAWKVSEKCPITKEELEQFKRSVKPGDRVTVTERVAKEDWSGYYTIKRKMYVERKYRHVAILRDDKEKQTSFTWMELVMMNRRKRGKQNESSNEVPRE